MGIVTQLPSGTPIKGTKVTKYVYAGQTITAGDFVTTVQGVSSTNTFTSTTNTTCTPIARLSDDKFLAVSGTNLYIKQVNKKTGAYTNISTLVIPGTYETGIMMNSNKFIYAYLDSDGYTFYMRTVTLNSGLTTLTDDGKTYSTGITYNKYREETIRNIMKVTDETYVFCYTATDPTTSSPHGCKIFTFYEGSYAIKDGITHSGEIYDYHMFILANGDFIIIYDNDFNGVTKGWLYKFDLSSLTFTQVTTDSESDLGYKYTTCSFRQYAQDPNTKELMFTVDDRDYFDTWYIGFDGKPKCLESIDSDDDSTVSTVIYFSGMEGVFIKKVNNSSNYKIYKNGVVVANKACDVAENCLPMSKGNINNAVSSTRYVQVSTSTTKCITAASMKSENFEEQVKKATSSDDIYGIATSSGTGGTTSTHGGTVIVYTP